jgi:hypothetical protein
VRSYEDALNQILALSSDMAPLERRRKVWLGRDLNAADKEEKVYGLEMELRRIAKEQMDVLQNLVQFPPHYLKYSELLKKLDETGPYRRRVFIMTKYRGGATQISMRNCKL